MPAAEDADKPAADVEDAPEGAASEEAAAAVEEVKEMSLDEYEALLAEKKAELNKARAARTVDASEFANLKALTKDAEPEANPLEVRTAVAAAQHSSTTRLSRKTRQTSDMCVCMCMCMDKRMQGSSSCSSISSLCSCVCH